MTNTFVQSVTGLNIVERALRKVSIFGVILVRIFPVFSRIRTEYEKILCPNAGKCGPE